MNETTQIPELIELPWYQKFCLDLTQTVLFGFEMRRKAAEKPLIVKALAQANGPKAIEETVEEAPDFVACQGPRCALFKILYDASGKAIGGQCAKALAPDAAMQQAHATRDLVKVTQGGSVLSMNGVGAKT